MATIHNSLGQSKVCHIEVWPDLSVQREAYRAYWVAPGETTGCPVVGYCSPGGSHRTIRAAIAECRRLGYSDPVFRNGRLIDEGV